MIGKIIGLLWGNVILFFKKLFGCRVKYHPYSLISARAMLKTAGKGSRIVFQRKCHVRQGSEIVANGGSFEFGRGCFVNKNCIINAHERIVIEQGGS